MQFGLLSVFLNLLSDEKIRRVVYSGWPGIDINTPTVGVGREACSCNVELSNHLSICYTSEKTTITYLNFKFFSIPKKTGSGVAQSV
jgi:hypothetical protein